MKTVTTKSLLIIIFLFLFFQGKTQICNCEKEFLFVKKTIEQNFSGFDDRIKRISKEVYNRETDSLLQLTRNEIASDNCPVIIDRFIDLFKSHHLGLYGTSDPAKTDTDFANSRPVFPISDKDIQRIKRSTSWEGIYYSVYDSSYKIAVLKDPSPMHDYIGIMLESKLPAWKKGMIKFEGTLENDSMLVGTLYMRNQHPRIGKEYFQLWQHNNRIGGDWRREGALKEEVASSNSSSSSNEPSPVIDAKMLSSKTLYIKLGSFGLNYISIIDSLVKANDSVLSSTPNLIIDVRDNGGGGDAGWEPFIPYLYTQSIKSIGVDIRSTDTTIAAYKKMLGNKDLPEGVRRHFEELIPRMEKAKGRWVTYNADQTISSFTPKPFPQKVVMITDRWCGSATEEFLLAAKQSSKVIIAGENTIGNLDYSNVVEVPLSCYPYMLTYPTTRSRRLKVNQGIDNVGIAPDHNLTGKDDWIKEALKIIEP